MTSAGVVVVGGGVIGVACAYELARAGLDVTLLESAPALGAGCSGGNAGLVCPSHAVPLATRRALREGIRWSLAGDSPLALRPRPALLPWLVRFAAASSPGRERAATELLRHLSLASLALHRRLGEEVGTRLEASGTLNVFETEAGFARARSEAAEHAAAGIRVELLSGAEACALEPALRGPVAGAVLYPDELSGDPLDFVRVLGDAARDHGATIATATEVLWLERRGRRIVSLETTAGRVAAETVVLAVGAWTPPLARTIGLSLPVEGGKGYHLDYEPLQAGPRLPVFLREAHVVVTPMPGRLRLAGTLELGGLDLSVDRRRVAAIERAGARRIRGLGSSSQLELWRGLRPCPPDGLPLLGRPAGYDNLVVATGHALLGLTLAPVSGELVARLVAGEEPAELALLDPDRFGARG